MKRAAAALLLAAVFAGPAAAWSVAPALERLRLDERTDEGRRLVRESGALVGLRVGHVGVFGERLGWQVGFGFAAGRIGYDGQTQGGAAAASRTRSLIGSADAVLSWPLSPAWSLEGGLLAEHFRRRIEGNADAGGLDERLWQARAVAGLAWRSGPWALRGRASHGDRGPLAVRFDGGAFDRVTLRSGRSDGLAFEAARALAPGWRLAGGVEQLAVGRSRSATLRSDGAAVGVVVQPAWTRQRVWLAAEWSGG